MNEQERILPTHAELDQAHLMLIQGFAEDPANEGPVNQLQSDVEECGFTLRFADFLIEHLHMNADVFQVARVLTHGIILGALCAKVRRENEGKPVPQSELDELNRMYGNPDKE